MEKEFIAKVHKGYRWSVAICDVNLKGQKLEEGEKQLDISTKFFEGDSVDSDELTEIIKKTKAEDATFYIVGEKSVDVAKSIGLVSEDGVSEIDSVPFALILL